MFTLRLLLLSKVSLTVSQNPQTCYRILTTIKISLPFFAKPNKLPKSRKTPMTMLGQPSKKHININPLLYSVTTRARTDDAAPPLGNLSRLIRCGDAGKSGATLEPARALLAFVTQHSFPTFWWDFCSNQLLRGSPRTCTNLSGTLRKGIGKLAVEFNPL